MSTGLSHEEFLLMQKFIYEESGIFITQDKSYLIESRLARLLPEAGVKTFLHFYLLLCKEKGSKVMAGKVIDAITTKETHWFRDRTPWYILEDVLLPAFVEEISQGKRSKVRIWSAACATGQEPYSVVMCIEEYLKRQRIRDINLSRFEILATDISPVAIKTAVQGRYDAFAMGRGLGDDYKASYFRQEGQVWVLNENIRDSVSFRNFNLKDSFLSLHNFDVIFCRYVTIYFLEDFKREVFRKFASVMNPQGVMFLGNSEIYPDYAEDFQIAEHKGGTYYRVRRYSV